MTIAQEVDREHVQAAMETGAIVVDALPAAPYSRRHLPGAVNVVAEDPDAQVRTVLPDLSAVVITYSTDEYCDRGPGLAERLITLGYTDVRNYRGGISDWVAAGLPVTD